ncbi:MAG: hypothetical protein O7F15_10650 [Gammaproteobacteria bacterium]|nr:hypothetical protein [Gammaproteobacteria bacterium]
MDNKATIIDLDQNKDLVNQSPDETVQTDFTLVASCPFPDKSEESKNRNVKANHVREFIIAKKNGPLSLKQKILNLIQSK